MGTDIHMAIEVKRGLRWQMAKIVPALRMVRRQREVETRRCLLLVQRIQVARRGGAYDQRSYDVFAILADVRNGTGFAGVDTGDGFIPIAPQRGLPADISAELSPPTSELAEGEWDVRYEAGLDLGEHSFSWLTLAELLAYPHWDGKTNQRGVLTAEEFRAWEKAGRGAPKSYCGGMSGAAVYEVSNATMRVLIADWIIEQVAERTGEAKRFKWENFAPPVFITTVEWTEGYREAAGSFASKFLPALRDYADAEKLDYASVRIVFGFDS